MDFAKRTLTVAGVPVEFDIDSAVIDDIDQAQRTSTKYIAFWGSVLASAEEEQDMADALYRNWRAKAAKRILVADSKAAEWKVKAEVESHDDFLKVKKALALAGENVEACRAMFEAFVRRANLAQSVGANQRESVKRLGTDVTRETAEPEAESAAAKRERLKKILREKKETAE